MLRFELLHGEVLETDVSPGLLNVPYFNAMLKGPWKESFQETVTVHLDCDKATLQTYLRARQQKELTKRVVPTLDVELMTLADFFNDTEIHALASEGRFDVHATPYINIFHLQNQTPQIQQKVMNDYISVCTGNIISRHYSSKHPSVGGKLRRFITLCPELARYIIQIAGMNSLANALQIGVKRRNLFCKCSNLEELTAYADRMQSPRGNRQDYLLKKIYRVQNRLAYLRDNRWFKDLNAIAEAERKLQELHSQVSK